MINLSYGTIFFALLFLSCDNTSYKAVVETVNGIEYIHNPEKPLSPKRSVSFVEELSIGTKEEKDGINLYQPSHFAIDANDNTISAIKQIRQLRYLTKMATISVQ